MTERRSKRDSTAVEEPVAAVEASTAAEEPVAAVEAPVEEPVAGAEAPAAGAEAPVAGAEAPVDEPMADEASTAEPTGSDAVPVVAPGPEAVPAPEADAAAEATAEPEAAPAPEAAHVPEAEADVPATDAAEPEVEAGEAIAAAVAEPAAEPGADERKPRGREKAPEAPARPAGPRGLKVRYQSDVIPALIRQFEYANPNQVPRVDKIVVNVGLGEALTNAKAIDAAAGDLTMITGQKPIVMKARRSIAQFRVRTGNPIGLKVTLRGQRMWDFLERLTLLTLPRIRDFRGTPSRSFDGRGNYTLGLREQIAFPEIDYDKVDRLRGLEVSIVTTAKSDEESKRLLELLGMPFAS
jgi:large subunit ribosomal protein L5